MKGFSLHRLRLLAREAFAPEAGDRLDSIAFGILVGFAGIAPFLYGLRTAGRRVAMGGGAVMPEGNVLLELVAFLMTGVVLLSKSRTRSVRPLAVPLGGMVALSLLGIVQLLPLGDGLLGKIAPTNARIYHETAHILQLFGKPAPRPRISIAPSETAETVLLTLSYACLFFSAASLLRTRVRRRLWVAVLLTTGVFQIALAVFREPVEDRLHGVFANPNHFAGYLEILLALAFGVLWTEVLTGSRRRREWADRAEQFESRFLPLAGLILLWSLIAAGIGLSQSRGAILSAALTVVILFVLALLHRRVRLRRRMAAGAAISILAGIVFIATTVGERPFLRFLESDPRDLGRDTRVALWRISLAAWRDFPVVGSGLGTFREAFRRVQTREYSTRVENAHSDFLQLLVTGGAIGALLGLIVFASTFFLLLRGWRRQRHREESALILAGFGALLSLVLHGLVEFNLSIPPITGTLACVLGAAWAAGRHP